MMSGPMVAVFFLSAFTLTAVILYAGRNLVRNVLRVARPETAGAFGDLDQASLLGDDSPLLLRENQVSSISMWAWILNRIDLVKHLEEAVTQAELNWSVGRVSLAILLSSALTFVVLRQISWLPGWGAVIFALLAGTPPYSYILARKEKRWRLIEDQFPDALESMSRALRAGHPFASALDSVCNQTAPPLSRELKKTFAEGAFGMTWEKALDNFCVRLPMEEVCMFAAAVSMQSRSGGNLSEVLDKLSQNMREGAAIRGEVRSLSSQGRAAGRILSLLPFLISGVLLYVNPRGLDPLFQEETGRTMLVCALLGLVAAHLIIRRLVDIRL